LDRFRVGHNDNRWLSGRQDTTRSLSRQRIDVHSLTFAGAPVRPDHEFLVRVPGQVLHTHNYGILLV